MKILLKAIIILIGLCMLVGTVMIFFKDIKILFTRESADYLSKISEVNRVFSMLFFIAYLFISVSIFKKGNALKILLLLSVFVLWLMCGRAVAFKAFPDGRIITGWYYIETDKFNLCEASDDCETIISQESVINKLSLWRINIKNKHVNKVVFIGPFTWNSCSNMFENDIGGSATSTNITQ